MTDIDSVKMELQRKLEFARKPLDSNEVSLLNLNSDFLDSIPRDALSIYVNSDLAVGDHILGFEPISINEIVAGAHPNYFMESKNIDFVRCDQAFLLPIYMGDSMSGSIDYIDLEDFSILYPICVFDRSYLYFHDSDVEGQTGIIGEVDSSGFYLAPSLSEHYSDLLDGLNEGSYLYLGGEIVFPSSWANRKGVRSGKLKMDNYGEIDV